MFEFDSLKSASNKVKHGIDFEMASLLWQDPNRLVIPARTIEEVRYLLIGEFDAAVWSVVYTTRGENIRIISARKARNNEKELYYSG